MKTTTNPTYRALRLAALCIVPWLAAGLARAADYEWTFDRGDLSADVGNGAMIYADADTPTLTLFGTTDGTTVPHIAGKPAKYMHVPAFAMQANGYLLDLVDTGPNGGGGYVNQYTFVFDVLIPGPLNWLPFFNTDPWNGNDADFYATDTGALGIGALGYSSAGAVLADTWVRMAFVADLGAGKATYYVNGTAVHALTGGSLLDGRFSLYSTNDTGLPGGHVRLLNEPSGAYTHELYVNSIAFTDRAMSSAEVTALGGPNAAGILLPGFTDPVLTFSAPAPNDVNVIPEPAFIATIHDGGRLVATNTIQLKLNGAPVTPAPSITKTGANTAVSFQGTGLLPSGSTNRFTLTYSATGAPAKSYTNDIPFVAANYRDIQLPAPIYFENFDRTPEGELPSGWTGTNYSLITDPSDLNLTNLDSAPFGGWTVVSVDRFTNIFLGYSDPTYVTTDYQRVLAVNPANVVNGQFVRHVATGRMLFGNSGYRNGDQVLYGFTPDFDLTGRTNVYLSFHSLWEQNQDSLGAVEYSIDRGQTWLPIVYMLDVPDVMTNTDGTIDALTTFTNEYLSGFERVASYFDPADGLTKGGYYGAFIGVASNLWSTLAPYISPRLNDDPAESKRVELLRLPQADRQANVRFRFAHAGTDSWYFGVDDFGLYSIAPATPPRLTIGQSGTNVVVSWPSSAGGFTLESSSGVTNLIWLPVPGVVNNSVSVPIGAGNLFFRLRQ